MNTATPMTLAVGSTNSVRLRRLRHEVTGDFIPTATVRCTLFDAEGDPVDGAIDLPMPFTAGASPSKGAYVGTIDDDVSLEAGAHYVAEITAVAPDLSERIFRVPCVAME